MSEGFRHPVRLPQYDSNETYYPRELSVDEATRTLYMRTSDESSDIILTLKGETPVKGIDYFTESDKQELINEMGEDFQQLQDSINNKSQVQIIIWEDDD